jgi:hypothetical protein
MPCGNFEELLLTYRELEGDDLILTDAHVASCAGCRDFLKALEELDEALTSELSQTRVSPFFQESVLKRVQPVPPIEKPSWIPEVLDFAGWSAVLAIAACLLREMVPPQFGSYYGWGLAVTFVIVGLWFGLRSYAHLNR